ncbi:MAG: hypothetical protein R2788_06230 [Saprospiraceae bacterium]
MSNPTIQPPLNNLQMELLKLFARQLPEKDLLAIKDMIAQYLLERTFELAGEEWEKRGYTIEEFQKSID